MALSATIYKAHINLSDLDRHIYQDLHQTLACHPSETTERMMVRVLAWLLNWTPELHFSRGLCAEDEPALWQHSLTGEIEHWIDVGVPSEEQIRKACHRSQRVSLYVYGTDKQVDVWWQKIHGKLNRFSNLTVYRLAAEITPALDQLVKPGMHLQATIEDRQIWLSDESQTLEISYKVLKEA